MAQARRRRAGSRLASLIGDASTTARSAARPSSGRVPLAALKPGRFNPRRNFAEAQLEELAASIRERGLVQPLVVRPSHAATPMRSSPASGAGARRSSPSCTTCRSSCAR